MSKLRGLVLAAAVGLTNVVVIAPTTGWGNDRSDEPDRGSEALPWVEPETAPLAKDNPGEPAEAEFPEGTSWTLTLGGRGDPGKVDAAVVEKQGDLPVSVSPGVDGVSGRKLEVQVFDRELSQKVGASGFVFRVSEVDGVLTRASKAGGLPAEITVNYADIARAYGADYHQRLRVRALDDCVLRDPRPRGCSITGRELPVENDVADHKLTAQVENLAKQGAVFAVTSAAGGDTGTFAATPMSIAGEWQVAPGSGEFTYSYPITVPKPASGAAPAVGLSYSSAAIDGMTHAANTQASETGLGWSTFANAYIERSYEPCVNTLSSPDLCWAGENATISLGGVGGAMVPVNGSFTQWQLLSDPGWKIERDNAAHTPEGKETHFKERWKVTGPDGTTYWFGFGHGPGTWTNSVLGIDVFADHPGDRCRGVNASPGHCRLEWRWYLDRVEDPDGMVTTYVYEKETNYYSARNGAFAPFNSFYDRSAYLTQILYGGHTSVWNHQEYSARVVFGTKFRCTYFNTQECPPPPQSQANLLYPDVPLDLVCTEPLGNCSVHSPSFFSSKHYTQVMTQVKKGGTEPEGPVDAFWVTVAATNLLKDWAWTPGTTWPAKLRLDRIQHVGIAHGGHAAYPELRLEYGYLPNRADVADPNSELAMRNLRLTRITNQFGGVTQINYGQKLPCASDYNPERWDENPRDCFPQTVVDNGHRRTGVFNKYLVAQVREQPGGGSPEMWTGYIYEGAPAWGFDDSSFARFDYLHGWSNWRGYGEAMVTKGTEQQIMSFDGESKTRIRVYRGMNGDRQLIQNPTGPGYILDTNLRPVSVESFDGAIFPDDRARAGRTIQEQRLGTLGSTQNTPVTSTSYEYLSRKTHEEAGDLRDAFWVGVWKVTERTYSSTTVYKQRRSVTTYTPTPSPQPATTVEEGFTDVTGDERCSITSYADNPTKWMWVYPARNEVAVGNTCAPGDTRVSVNETYYDGDTSTTPGGTPTRGNPTRQRSLVEGTRWTQSRTEFDELGRITKVTDPNGRVTTTDYKVDLSDGVADEIEDSSTDGSPLVAIPAKVTVTNPLGHKTVTYLNPEETSLKAEFDANGMRTSYTYDAFGNLTSVRLPTEHGAGDEPSWQFSYDVINRVVSTRQLTSTVAQGSVVFEDSSTIFDGFWRERQTQTQSPASGKVLVSETTYDERGLTRDETASQAFTGTPGTFIDVGSGWANRTRHIYDKLGREIENQWWRGLTPVTPSTTTSYGANTVTVAGPTGQVARETVDGLGRTVEVAERNGATWATSTMTYDLADRLLTVTDPEGNRATYSYYLTGWLLARTDPDRAGALHFYDDAGNNTSTLTTGNNWVYTKYDALNRPLDRRKDSATGPLLASWTYDTASGGKGRPHTETTHTAVGNWVRTVTGYDGRGRANGTTLTVPTGIPGLSGSYTTSQTYDRADRIKTVTYPAIGGLTAETVTTNYSNQGLPISMTGADQYVRSVSYDDRGRAATAAFGPDQLEGWMKKTYTFDPDQRLASAETSIVNGSAYQTVAKHTLAYNLDGNVKTRTSLLNGSQWTECFGYDARGRLTDAYTVPTVNMCGVPTERGTGPQPYNHVYAYSPAGRMTQRTENGIVTNYTYPASGQPRPHAPTRVGTDTYQWDDRGNLKSRTVGGVAETFAWDVEGRLTSVNTTSFIYDPSGQRLLRKTNAGATLYLAGHEVTANPSGSSVTAVRSYTFGGQLVATRRTGQPADYIVSDPSGSLELAVPSGATAATASRKYNPYGKVRSETGDMATEQGFVGQIEDASTSLSYLNARYYDTRTAVFVSPDPVMDPKSPKSLNAYTYAANNPTSFSDASGMSPSYIYGIETENIALRAHNKELLDHIGRLNGQLQELQGIILEQQRQINELLTHIDALTAIIYEQQALIEKLVARVQYLERVVRAQQAQIRSLQAKIKYYEGVITQLVVHAFNPPYVLPLLADIFAGKGITSWDGSKVNQLQALVDFWRPLALDRGSRIIDLEGQLSDANYTISDYETMIADAVEQRNESNGPGALEEFEEWHMELYGTPPNPSNEEAICSGLTGGIKDGSILDWMSQFSDAFTTPYWATLYCGGRARE